MTTQADTNLATGVNASAEARTGALIALLLGAFLVFTTGFAYSSTLHNAAHDTRHAVAFPCH